MCSRLSSVDKLLIAVISAVALVVVSAVVVLSSMPLDAKTAVAVMYAFWNGGLSGYVVGIYAATRRRRKTHGEKNLKEKTRFGLS